MRQVRRTGRAAVVALAVVLLTHAAPAAAHVEKRSGPFRVSLGWVDEPALSGAPNAVEVALADAGGSAVPVPAGALQVEVSFAGTATTLPLVPADEGGGLRALVIPTRAGSYAFHVTGALRGRTVDVRATCGSGSFDCVT